MSDWMKNDELFFKELKDGRRFENYVAELLASHGLRVEQTPLAIRGSIDDIEQFSDQVDIKCQGRYLEIKSRKEPFTCPDDFPYRTIIVDTVCGWKNKRVKPLAYVCISQLTGSIIATPSKPQDWQAVRRYDRTRGIWDEFYECDKGRWYDISVLIQYLKGCT